MPASQAYFEVILNGVLQLQQDDEVGTFTAGWAPVCGQEQLWHLCVVAFAHAAVPQAAHAVVRPERAVAVQVNLEVTEEGLSHQLCQDWQQVLAVHLFHECEIAVCTDMCVVFSPKKCSRNGDVGGIDYIWEKAQVPWID